MTWREAVREWLGISEADGPARDDGRDWAALSHCLFKFADAFERCDADGSEDCTVAFFARSQDAAADIITEVQKRHCDLWCLQQWGRTQYPSGWFARFERSPR